MRTLDLKIGWEHKIGERFIIEPSVSFYNVANFANFDGPNNPLSPTLNAFGDPTSGSINNTTYSQRTSDRIGVGTGVFGLGAPRAMEFGLKLTF